MLQNEFSHLTLTSLWSCEIKSCGFHSVLLPVYLVSTRPYRTLIKKRKTSQKNGVWVSMSCSLGFSGRLILYIIDYPYKGYTVRQVGRDVAYSRVFHFGFCCFCSKNHFRIFTKVLYAWSYFQLLCKGIKNVFSRGQLVGWVVLSIKKKCGLGGGVLKLISSVITVHCNYLSTFSFSFSPPQWYTY